MNGSLRIGLCLSMLALAMTTTGSVAARPGGGLPACDAGNIGETYTTFQDNGNGSWYYFYYQCTNGGWMPIGGDYCYFTFPPGGGNYVCIPL